MKSLQESLLDDVQSQAKSAPKSILIDRAKEWVEVNISTRNTLGIKTNSIQPSPVYKVMGSKVKVLLSNANIFIKSTNIPDWLILEISPDVATHLYVYADLDDFSKLPKYIHGCLTIDNCKNKIQKEVMNLNMDLGHLNVVAETFQSFKNCHLRFHGRGMTRLKYMLNLNMTKISDWSGLRGLTTETDGQEILLDISQTPLGRKVSKMVKEDAKEIPFVGCVNTSKVLNQELANNPKITAIKYTKEYIINKDSDGNWSYR